MQKLPAVGDVIAEERSSLSQGANVIFFLHSENAAGILNPLLSPRMRLSSLLTLLYATTEKH
jgi:hypothetical protein